MKKYLTVKDASKFLGVSTNTVYKYLKEKKVKSKRIGRGRFKIPRSELLPFVDLSPEPRSARRPSRSFFSFVGKSEKTLTSFKGASYDVQDFIFFRLFVGFILFGAGVVFLLVKGRLVLMLSQSTNLGEFGLLIWSGTIILSNFLAGALIFGEIFLPAIFKRRYHLVQIFSVLVLALDSYLAFSLEQIEPLFLFGSLFIVVLSQIVRGYSLYKEKGSFEKEFIYLAVLSSIILGVATLYNPEFFPFIKLRPLIAAHKGWFSILWTSVAILPLMALTLPQVKKSNLDLVIWPILIFWAAAISTTLSVEGKWMVYYCVYVYSIFIIFLIFWKRSAKKLSAKDTFSISLAFFWSVFVLALGIFSIALSQKGQVNNELKRMQTVHSEVSRDLNYLIETLDRRLITEINKSRISEIISSRSESAAISEARAIYDKAQNLRRILLLDANGIVLGGYPRESLLQGTNLSSREHFQAARITLKPQTSELYTSVTGDPIVPRSYPIIKNNRFIGVIIFAPDLPGISIEYQNRNGGLPFYAFDSNGKYVLHPDTTKIGTSVDPTIALEREERHIRGIRVLRVYDSVGLLGITTYSESSLSVLFGSLVGLNVVVGVLVLANTILAFRFIFPLPKKWEKI